MLPFFIYFTAVLLPILVTRKSHRKIFTKKSKSYGDNPHKNYFIAYREGSYFTGDSNKIKGRVLENINPKDPKVIQNLIPFCVGVKDE